MTLWNNLVVSLWFLVAFVFQNAGDDEPKTPEPSVGRPDRKNATKLNADS